MIVHFWTFFIISLSNVICQDFPPGFDGSDYPNLPYETNSPEEYETHGQSGSTYELTYTLGEEPLSADITLENPEIFEKEIKSQTITCRMNVPNNTTLISEYFLILYCPNGSGGVDECERNCKTQNVHFKKVNCIERFVDQVYTITYFIEVFGEAQTGMWKCDFFKYNESAVSAEYNFQLLKITVKITIEADEFYIGAADKTVICSAKSVNVREPNVTRWFRLYRPCGENCVKIAAEDCDIQWGKIVSCEKVFYHDTGQIIYKLEPLNKLDTGDWICELYHDKTLMGSEKKHINIISPNVEIRMSLDTVDAGENNGHNITCFMTGPKKYSTNTYRRFHLLCPCGHKCLQKCADDCFIYENLLKTTMVTCQFATDEWDMKVYYQLKHFSTEHDGHWACELYENFTMTGRSEDVLKVRDNAAIRRLTAVPRGKIAPGTFVRFLCEAVHTVESEESQFEWFQYKTKGDSLTHSGNRAGGYTSVLILQIQNGDAGTLTCRLGLSKLSIKIEFLETDGADKDKRKLLGEQDVNYLAALGCSYCNFIKRCEIKKNCKIAFEGSQKFYNKGCQLTCPKPLPLLKCEQQKNAFSWSPEDPCFSAVGTLSEKDYEKPPWIMKEQSDKLITFAAFFIIFLIIVCLCFFSTKCQRCCNNVKSRIPWTTCLPCIVKKDEDGKVEFNSDWWTAPFNNLFNKMLLYKSKLGGKKMDENENEEEDEVEEENEEEESLKENIDKKSVRSRLSSIHDEKKHSVTNEENMEQKQNMEEVKDVDENGEINVPKPGFIQNLLACFNKPKVDKRNSIEREDLENGSEMIRLSSIHDDEKKRSINTDKKEDMKTENVNIEKDA